MARLRVCHISTVHRPFDVRIFHKMCGSLAEAGFDVRLVVKEASGTQANGVRIHKIPAFKKRPIRMTLGVMLAFFKTLFINPKVIHFHDPELIPLGLIFKRLGKKVIYDMHELVSHQLDNKAYLSDSRLGAKLKHWYAKLEDRAVRRLDGIILAEDGYVHHMNQRYPESSDKFLVVRNFPRINQILNTPTQYKDHDAPVVVYMGGLTKIRGIKELIQAVAAINNAKLVLMGPWTEEFRVECEAMEEFRCVDYRGVLPFEEVIKVVKTADVGAATLYPLENYLTSQPVKFFEYVACQVPIVMSNFPYWEELFDGMAWFADPRDPNSIRETIEEVLIDSQKRVKMDRAFEKVNSEWNWELEQAKLTKLYQRFE